MVTICVAEHPQLLEFLSIGDIPSSSIHHWETQLRTMNPEPQVSKGENNIKMKSSMILALAITINPATKGRAQQATAVAQEPLV
jgi:hypothetical protein